MLSASLNKTFPSFRSYGNFYLILIVVQYIYIPVWNTCKYGTYESRFATPVYSYKCLYGTPLNI